MSERGEIQFGNTTIPYTIVRSRRRRKTIAITLDPTEGVLVAVPFRTAGKRITEIVTKRAGWILRKASDELLYPRPKQFVSGESLLYLGREAQLCVEHTDAKRVGIGFDHWSFQIKAPAGLAEGELRAKIEQAMIRWYYRQATERLADRADHWSAVAGVAPRAVLIRDQRQRWGSCSPDGTLRFNWRIVMAPPALIDYVVVHELAHLRVRNHSAAFWAEVAKLMPDYLTRRADLREMGPRLAL